jgi:hypothetical protein
MRRKEMKSIRNTGIIIETMQKAGKGLIMGVLVCAIAVFMLADISQATDRLKVKDASGNTKFVVTDAGKTGVRTATPGTSLHVIETYTGATRGIMSAQHNDSATGAGMVFRKSRGTDTAPTILSNGDYIGMMYGQGHDGSAYQIPAFLGFRVDGTPASGTVPTAFVVYTGNSSSTWGQRFRISSTGKVGIGVTPTHLLHLSGGAYSDGATWVDASSREYKDNIRDLSKEEALKAFSGLNPVTYNYKTSADEKRVGFIAEDVPEIVATKDRKGLSPMDIVAVLTKVVQDQKQSIDTLKNELEGMKEELKRLKASQQ